MKSANKQATTTATTTATLPDSGTVEAAPKLTTSSAMALLVAEYKLPSVKALELALSAARTLSKARAVRGQIRSRLPEYEQAGQKLGKASKSKGTASDWQESKVDVSSLSPEELKEFNHLTDLCKAGQKLAM